MPIGQVEEGESQDVSQGRDGLMGLPLTRYITDAQELAVSKDIFCNCNFTFSFKEIEKEYGAKSQLLVRKV